MEAMMIKDFKVLTKNKMFILWNIMIIIYAVITGVLNKELLMISRMFTMLGAYYFSMILMWGDDKKGMYLSSLPMARANIILSKYLVLILYSLGITFFQEFIGNGLRVILYNSSIRLDSIVMNISIVILVSIVLESMFITLYTKFGYNGNINAIMIFAMAIFPALIRKMFTEEQIIGFVQKFNETFSNGYTSGAMFLSIAAIICIVSMYISVHFYKAKEF